MTTENLSLVSGAELHICMRSILPRASFHLSSIITVNRHVLVTEIASPVLCTLSVLDTEINKNLQIFLGQQLGGTSLVDVGFRFTVGQEVEWSGIGGSFWREEGDGHGCGGDCSGGEVGVSAVEGKTVRIDAEEMAGELTLRKESFPSWRLDRTRPS
jgi:hypothetical protein